MTPRLLGQNCKSFKIPSSLIKNTFEYKENQTKQKFVRKAPDVVLEFRRIEGGPLDTVKFAEYTKLALRAGKRVWASHFGL